MIKIVTDCSRSLYCTCGGFAAIADKKPLIETHPVNYNAVLLALQHRPSPATTALTATCNSEHGEHGKREIEERDGVSHEVLLVCCYVAVRAAEGRGIGWSQAEHERAGKGGGET